MYMNHVIVIPRLQMQLSSLEDIIDLENPVRFVPDYQFEPVGPKSICMEKV